MIATDGDGRFQVAATDEFVDCFAHLGAFAVAEPADARGQSLKLHAFAREPEPAVERRVFGEEFEREVVRAANVRRVARQSHPAKRPFAFAKKRADVFGHEAGNLEGVAHPAS